MRPGDAETGRDVALDALRGLAVAAVVVHHAANLAGPDRAGWLATPAAVGDVGVAIFFVLSGYLIYRPFVQRHLDPSTPFSLRSFWWRRALRVLPAYWVALAVFVALGTIEPTSVGDLLAHVTLLNVFRPGSLFNGISQGWSLTVELCFYAAIPGWSWLMRRRGIATRGSELGGIALLAIGAHVFRAVVYSVEWHVGEATLRGISYLWLPTHLDVLAAGMAVAVVAVRGAPAKWAGLARGLVRSPLVAGAVAAALLAGYAAVLGAPSIATGYSLWHLEVRQVVYATIGVLAVAPFAWRGAALGAGPGATAEGRAPRRDRAGAPRRVAWWCGALSYGVYLFHNDLMEEVTRRVGAGAGDSPLGRGLSDMAFWPLLGVGVVGGAVAAFLSWTLIEAPSRRLRHWADGPGSIWSHLSERGRTAAGLAIVAVVIALPLRGLFGYQGPPMEEGFMLAFPEQLLAGRLPHRDFLHLYGPGSLWLLAGLFEVFGTSLTLERLVGLAQHVAVAVGLFALLRPWGRRVATSGAVVSVLILISPLGLSAMAWNGALAAAVCGLALLTDTASRERSDSSTWRLSAAGVLAGVALLFRPDLVVAVTLGFGAALLGIDRGRRRPAIIAAAVTLAAYVPHVLTSGIEASFRGMFLEPVFELRAGRSLPVPPSFGEVDGFLQRAGAIRVVGWPLPMLATSVQIHLWFWVVLASCGGSLAAGWWARRHHTPHADVLWPATLFGAALVSQAVQRPDTAHLSWVTGITLPITIAAIVEVLSVRRKGWSSRRRIATAVAVVAVVLVAVIPFYPLRTYADLVTQSAGFNRFGFPIRRADRVFYYGSADAARAGQAVADRLAAQSRPGERLIVGPVDLSKTPYSDAFFYFLFPDLTPGTRYIEMDPGIADAPDSGLAEELRRADWLIRSGAWSGWDEPNDSRFAGSSEPNAVVAKLYCMELDAGTFQLLRRCRG